MRLWAVLFDFSLQNSCLEAGALLSLSRQEAGRAQEDE